MEIPNKRELQQTTYNHSSYIEFKDFMNFYIQCTAKPCFYQLLMLFLCFRKNLLETIEQLIMTNDDKIRDEKHNINRETAKISALSS